MNFNINNISEQLVFIFLKLFRKYYSESRTHLNISKRSFHNFDKNPLCLKTNYISILNFI